MRIIECLNGNGRLALPQLNIAFLWGSEHSGTLEIAVDVISLDQTEPKFTTNDLEDADIVIDSVLYVVKVDRVWILAGINFDRSITLSIHQTTGLAKHE